MLTACGAVALAVAAPEVIEDGFDRGLAGWEPITAANWAVVYDEADNAYLELVRPGKLREGVRRPGDYVLRKGGPWRDVTLTARVRSLRPSTLKGRDVVLIFGWQDDTHCYYTHLSNDSNNSTHNVIMKVSGDQRRAIMVEKKPEPRLTNGWHTARVTHSADGRIAVYFDDLTTPLMTATDTDYPAGRVGVGAFDDPAAFDDIRIEGEPVAP